MVAFAALTFKSFVLEQTSKELHARATLAGSYLASALLASDYARVDSLCKELGGRTETRFTAVLSSGKVIGDSREDPALMENHANRPEVKAALAGDIGTVSRYSFTVRQNMMYVAIPIVDEGQAVAVMRAAVPLSPLDQALTGVYLRLVISGVMAALIVALANVVLGRRISRILREMRASAREFMEGNLRGRSLADGPAEVSELSDTLNDMAAQLDARIKATLKQRKEQDAVLASMVEGVVAVDRSERILDLNRAAEMMLGVDTAGAAGRYVVEVVRNARLQRFVKEASASSEPVEESFALHAGENRYVQAHGTVLRDADGEAIGAVIVLNDITRLRKLENVRRDFVANVSHELKTPVTSIKGFVETLLDGALEDPQDAKRFLEIIMKHADRLNKIIDDLLSLSRIEQEAETSEITLSQAEVLPLLQSSIQFCETEAGAMNIRVEVSCSEKLRARMNPDMVEQAITNLLDNAIKYSEPGNVVKIEAAQERNEIRISVIDRGIGIPKEHLSRIFERFYRVDKERSRNSGGTGLGLAIVKHIAQAHRGRTTVESEPGTGSTFSIYLPL